MSDQDKTDALSYIFNNSSNFRLSYADSLEVGEDALMTFRLQECSCGHISGGPIDNCWYCGKSFLNGVELALRYLKDRK